VPTATLIAPSERSFALRLAAWSVGLFGLFRLPWVAEHLLLPTTQWQAAVGAALLGPSTLPIEATLACSGADAVALCFAAILSYPTAWRARAQGAAAGLIAILALNIIRIGTLGRAAASPVWFNALHVYIWPMVLTVAIGALVFGWMRFVDHPRVAPAVRPVAAPAAPLLSVRFALATAAGLVLFTLCAPIYLASERVLAVAVLVARAAATLLRAAGVTASASNGVLATSGGAFLVTQECISTPLIPVYVAAVLVYARPWRRTAFWALAGVPLFVALGIARLLVVAIPAGIDRPPAFLVHAFSQLLVGTGMVCGVAVWRSGTRAATCVRAVAALALAVAFVEVAGASYTQAIRWFDAGAFVDTQGALTFLPAFQIGLFLALWVAGFLSSGWRRLLCGAALLAVVQIAAGDGVQLLFVHAGVAPLIRDIRAWALVGPALVIAMVVNIAPSRR
jgi:exosortase/archaeosortase family protein